MAQTDPLAPTEVARDKLATLGNLTAGIAHDLNNPIGYIASNLNSLQRYHGLMTELIELADSRLGEDRQWRRALDDAHWDFIRNDIGSLLKETRQGADLLRDVVTSLRLLGRSSEETHQASFDDCIHSALLILRYQMRVIRRVDLHLDAAPLFHVARSRILQLLINIVHNAIQAQKDSAEPALVIRSRIEDEHAVIDIEDNGPGIPAHRRDAIFEAGVTSKPDADGTGIGLTIVRGIAVDHDGSVCCLDPATLAGACFRIVLGHRRVEPT